MPLGLIYTSSLEAYREFYIINYILYSLFSYSSIYLGYRGN